MAFSVTTKPKPQFAVDHRGAGGLSFHYERGSRHDVPLIDALDVLGDVDDAVGIVADQVGFYLVGGDDFRFVLRGALGNVYMVSDFPQILWSEYRHDYYPLPEGCPQSITGPISCPSA